jgi:nucleotide-binding universal stress UspA family protein
MSQIPSFSPTFSTGKSGWDSNRKKKRREFMIPQIKKILYATDLSKNSAYALFYAVDLAKRHDARIIILHAIQPVPHLYSYGESFQAERILMKTKEQEQKTDIDEIKNRLRQFCGNVEVQTGPPCVELVTKILVPLGHPEEEILKIADEESCDVIVLGTHGKGFLRQTFLGSVAGSVLERTRKPVFIIPLPSEKTNIDWEKI